MSAAFRFALAAACATLSSSALADGREELPVDAIQDIIGAEGHVSNDVLSIDIAREDLKEVRGPLDVELSPAFALHGTLYFQPLHHGDALLNGDVALLPHETNPFIAALFDNGIELQAFHQHLIDVDPNVWCVHFRAVGNPKDLAGKIRNAIATTSTPLPQAKREKPTSPLDADKLAGILHGEAEIGDEGVVTVTVNRKDGIEVGGIEISPEAGISTSIEFKPMGEGSKAAVLPDFSMRSDEVGPVVGLMLRELGWFQGCLYNQETGEDPQLYFDHMLKTGDAYELAAEIRRGLDLTRSE